MTKTKLDRFRVEHPVCAFCAGERPTTSQDHQPGRVFFRGKRVPDNMIVPACDACQSASRRAEAAMSLFLLPLDPNDRDFELWQKRIDHARRNFPELVPQLPSSTREARKMAKSLGIKPLSGMFYKDIPMSFLDTDDYQELFDMFARKITLAHFYRCFRRPLSREGALFAATVPNAHIGDGKWLEGIVSELPHAEVGVHGRDDMGDQITTRWHASKDGNLGIFVTHIQETIFVVGMTGEHDRWIEFLNSHGKLSGPLP